MASKSFSRLLMLLVALSSSSHSFLLPGTPELDLADHQQRPASLDAVNPSSKLDDYSSRLGEPISSIPHFLGTNIKIYEADESTDQSRFASSSQNKVPVYNINPGIALVDQSSVHYWYSSALNQHFIGFRVNIWNETLLDVAASHLSQTTGHPVQPYQIQTVPFDRVILKSISDSKDRYSTAHSWVPYKEAIGLSLTCYDQLGCKQLAYQLKSDSKFVLEHFKLAYSRDENRKTDSKKIDISPSLVLEKNQLLAKIINRYSKISEVLVTVADLERILWSATSNIVRRHFENDQVVVPRESHKLIYDRLEKWIVAGRTSITAPEDSRWNLVYWEDQLNRPDAVARSLNDRRRQSVHGDHNEDSDGQQEVEEQIPGLSGEWKKEAIEASINQIYAKQREFVKFSQTGQFVPKPLQLCRLKLNALASSQPWQSVDKIQINFHPHVDYIGFLIGYNNDLLIGSGSSPATPSSLAKLEDGIGKSGNIISRLIAGETLIVRLKNARTGEYLYPGRDELSHDSKRRRVFTWRNTNEPTGTWAEWRLTGLWRAGTFRIRITTVRFPGEYLYPSSDEFTYDKERRRVFTWRQSSKPEDVHLWADGAADWLLDTYRVNTDAYPNRYTLFNLKRREYLYAAPDRLALDETRRRVFTWRGTDNEVWTELKNQWDIQVVRSV